jgi:hypothetical protein
MTDDQTAALIHAEFAKIRESFKPHKFWDWLTKIAVVATVAIASFIWGHEARLDDHTVRLALIEQTRFTGADGSKLKDSITDDLRHELDGIKTELKTISERLATLEAKSGE